MAGIPGFPQLDPLLKENAAQPGVPPATTDPRNNQSLIDYSAPSYLSLQDELALKLAQSGQAPNYDHLSIDTDLKQQNGQVVATAAGNGRQLGILGPVPMNETPADTLRPDPSDNTLSYKVKITAEPTGDVIVFDTMPQISELQYADYQEFTPVHHPGAILKYAGTRGREWSLTIKLIVRTALEASANLEKINIIRSWLMPYHGQGTADSTETKRYLGAPPPILTLTGYGPKVIGPIKCVLQNYQWTWDNDVDWVQTADSVPVAFPVLLTVQMALRESWSPREFSNFNLLAYRSGDLGAAFSGGVPSSQRSTSGSSAPSGLAPSAVDPSQPAMATNAQLRFADSRANGLQNPVVENKNKVSTRLGSEAIAKVVKG